MKSNYFYPALSFTILTSAVYVICLLFLNSQFFLLRPDLISWAVTFDLTLSVPFLYWWLMIHKAHLPAVSIIPVFLLSLIVASLVVPSEHQQFLRLAGYLFIPAELVIVGVVGFKAYRAAIDYRQRRAARGTGDDMVGLLRGSLRDALHIGRAAEVIADEIVLLYYALFSWRERVVPPPGARAFSYHKENGFGVVLLALAFVAVLELAVIHVLVTMWWSGKTAWVLSGISFYGLVWLLGFYQAVRLRPILVGTESLHIRTGLRWSIDVPFSNVVRVYRANVNEPYPKHPDYLKAVSLGEPQLMIELNEPLIAHGLFGMRRNVIIIGFCVDELELFKEALDDGIGSGARAGDRKRRAGQAI